MNIYGIEITISPSPVRVYLRHDWLVRQYEDCVEVTNNAIKLQK